MNYDKIICEQVENHLRSQIPSIAQNIHEAFGEGFGQRAKLFGREMGQRYLASLHRDALVLQSNLGASIMKNRLKVRDAHLLKSGINPTEYNRTMTYPVNPPAPLSPGASTTDQQIYKAHLDAYHERKDMQSKIDYHALRNPALAKSMAGIQDQNRFINRLETKQLRRIDPGNILAGVPISPAAKAEALKSQRLGLKAQRQTKIPGEYSTYRGGRYLATGVAPGARLTGLGKILQGIETII